HTCEIGEFSRFAAQVGIAGSTKIGKWCQFGGQSAAADHATIGDRVMLVAKSAVHNDVPDGAIMAGVPATDIVRWRRWAMSYMRVPELIRRVRAIEKRLGSGGDEE